MSTLIDHVITAEYKRGYMHIRMQSGQKVAFPIDQHPRLSKGTPKQLNNIELSPFGLHWPDLDEDLSFQGLLEGNFGQRKK